MMDSKKAKTTAPTKKKKKTRVLVTVPDAVKRFSKTSEFSEFRSAFRSFGEYVQNLEQKVRHTSDALVNILETLPVTTTSKALLDKAFYALEYDPSPEQHTNLYFTEKPNMQALKKVLASGKLSPEKQSELQVYYDLVRRHGGSLRVHYKRKRYNGVAYGRYYPVDIVGAATLQSSNVRCIVFGDEETDVDIENCAYTIVTHLCHVNHIPCPHTEAYLVERQTFLDSIALTPELVATFNGSTGKKWSRAKQAKRVLTSLMYAPGLSHLQKSYGVSDPSRDLLGERVTSLFTELQGIKRQLVSLPEYEDMISDISTAKRAEGEHYHDGTGLSYIVNTVETEMVLKAINKFTHCGFEVRSYAYDGFHVASRDHVAIQEVLDTLNATLPVKFLIKPWPTSLFELDPADPSTSSAPGSTAALAAPKKKKKDQQQLDPNDFLSMFDASNGSLSTLCSTLTSHKKTKSQGSSAAQKKRSDDAKKRANEAQAKRFEFLTKAYEMEKKQQTPATAPVTAPVVHQQERINLFSNACTVNNKGHIFSRKDGRMIGSFSKDGIRINNKVYAYVNSGVTLNPSQLQGYEKFIVPLSDATTTSAVILKKKV